MVSCNDVGLAALLEVHGTPQFEECSWLPSHACGCIAAHENGLDNKCLTDWFCIRFKAKRNPKRSRSECLPADQSSEKLVLIHDMIQKGETLRLHGWLYRLETVGKTRDHC